MDAFEEQSCTVGGLLVLEIKRLFLKNLAVVVLLDQSG